MYRCGIARSGNMVVGWSISDTVLVTHPVGSDYGYGHTATVVSLSEDAATGEVHMVGFSSPRVDAQLPQGDQLYQDLFGEGSALESQPTWARIERAWLIVQRRRTHHGNLIGGRRKRLRERHPALRSGQIEVDGIRPLLKTRWCRNLHGVELERDGLQAADCRWGLQRRCNRGKPVTKRKLGRCIERHRGPAAVGYRHKETVRLSQRHGLRGERV